MKRRNQKVILKYFSRTFETFQELIFKNWWAPSVILVKTSICSLSTSPQTANQEKILLEGVSESEQGSFTNVCREAAALVKNSGHLMKDSPLQKWPSSHYTVPNQISVNNLVSQHKRKMQTQETQDKQQVLYGTELSTTPAFLIWRGVQVSISWHK